MATLSELIEAGRQHRVTLTNEEGKPLLDLALIWAVLITLAAPQALVLVLVLALLELINVELDGRRLGPVQDV